MKNRILHTIIRRATAFLSLVALASSFAVISSAQDPSTEPTPAVVTKAELHQALLDLTNPWTVMCVAAHPDDEDGTTLTVLRRKHGAHTVSLFSTYGEGGQNAVGPELYEELGVIRYYETLKASEIQGSEPHFLGLKDFGFSKSMEETFRFWNREEALKRMVLKLRELRPDVIITNHDTARGHGHHQATGQLLLEAFDAAADPKRFPEQLTDNIKPWQVQRVFVRIFGGPAPTAQAPAAAPSKIISIDPNEIDPIRETSFAEQALAALQQHRSQGPWPKSVADMMRARRIESGKLPPIRYRLVREAANAPPLPETAATPSDGLKLATPVAERLSAPTIDERPLTEFVDQQSRVLDALINRHVTNVDAPKASEDVARVALFDARVNKALAVAAGVSLNISSDKPLLIRGQKNTFGVTLVNGGPKSLQISRLAFEGWGKKSTLDVPDHLLADTETNAAVELTTPANTPFTLPKVDHLYGELFDGVPFSAAAAIDIEGARFTVKTVKTFDVAPAVEMISVSPSPCVRTEEMLGKCKLLNVTFSNHLASPFRGTLLAQVTSLETLHSHSVKRQVVLGPGETRTDQISLDSPIPEPQNLRHLRGPGLATLSLQRFDSKELITERKVSLVYANAKVAPDLNVAYIPSFDQTLERSLASFGLEAKVLTVADIKTKELAVYDTIIIDNRGYEAHPGLIEGNPRLLQFVEDGGTLIVFYHKDNEWNPDAAKNRPQLAPYPIVLGGDRVTDENAPVRFLQPRHRLMNYPNRITQADFRDWIQERGLYYPKEWDRHYTALFSTNDPGEPALRGGLLVAKKGLGNYIYTSMVWYRQLRAGVPGSYRMFANMISYGKSTATKRASLNR
ncbi:MAG TPA: PIG-L family deacetylase [Pyrinomonadaceae bacterium]|nr:PIG-L family deacetylase [Pyrinomonadaceae bacterium]